MASKIRKQIYIEPDQNTVLKRLSEECGMPEAEIIREAITQHVQGLRVTCAQSICCCHRLFSNHPV
jgi:hypothetical protein